jgi:hypothetical protein
MFPLRRQCGMINGVGMWEVVTLSSPGPTSFCDQHKFFATLAAIL